MDFRRLEIGMTDCWVGRMTYTGDLGYEIWVAPEYQRNLFDAIMAAGEPHGLRLFGVRALLTMRLEKMFGTWFREYRPIFTPFESRMDRYIKLDHEFIGRAALEAAGRPKRYLSYFEVDPDPNDPADVIGDEPVWHNGAGRVARGRLDHVGWLRPLQREVAGTRLHRGSHRRRPWRGRVRDRDHRAAPTGSAAARTGPRPAWAADAELTMARSVDFERRTALLDEVVDLPQRARAVERVVATDGEGTRASASTRSCTTSATRTI